MSVFNCCQSECQNPSKSVCGGCKVVRYCSAECQKSDWNQQHKVLCTAIKAAQTLLNSSLSKSERCRALSVAQFEIYFEKVAELLPELLPR